MSEDERCQEPRASQKKLACLSNDMNTFFSAKNHRCLDFQILAKQFSINKKIDIFISET